VVSVSISVTIFCFVFHSFIILSRYSPAYLNLNFPFWIPLYKILS
jgi:hypothetical protein